MHAFLIMPGQVRGREFHLSRLYAQVLGRVAFAADHDGNGFGIAPDTFDGQG